MATVNRWRWIVHRKSYFPADVGTIKHFIHINTHKNLFFLTNNCYDENVVNISVSPLDDSLLISELDNIRYYIDTSPSHVHVCYIVITRLLHRNGSVATNVASLANTSCHGARVAFACLKGSRVSGKRG